MIELVESYTHGLDEALGGGLPRPGLTLIVGHPGTGKTTLSAQILSNRALKNGEKGVYFSVVEPVKLLTAQLSRLDIGFKDAVDRGLITVREAIAISGRDVIEVVSNQINDLVYMGYRNLVVDSISALLTFTATEHARTLVSLLSKYAVESNAMVIAIDELPLFSQSKPISGFEEFVADVVIRLGLVERGNRLLNVMSIVKNRFAEHSKVMYEVAVTRRGFEVIGVMR
ncbi:MAG: ATPase domain-containing protein [Candidatus Nezhaarchaeales archaeon]